MLKLELTPARAEICRSDLIVETFSQEEHCMEFGAQKAASLHCRHILSISIASKRSKQIEGGSASNIFVENHYWNSDLKSYYRDRTLVGEQRGKLARST